ncbi:MAG TPA: lamin tail domain-containing protein, partial [Flavobacteriales bacterium]|nr:lamin tail domain-containing protein [Flavobacteriales bacterium]
SFEPSISEIHYNPSTQQGSDNLWEFVEIYNHHEFGLDISGWHLADAVNATVPPNTWLESGAYAVFANDTASYNQLLPFTLVIPFSGNAGSFYRKCGVSFSIPFSGNSSLHNSGETIRLLRADGSQSDYVEYSDYGGWPAEPDGGGPTLEWKGPVYENSLPSSWTPSNAFGGSPGSANSTWAD